MVSGGIFIAGFIYTLGALFEAIVHSREINDNPALSLSLLSEFRKISNIPYEVDFADVAMDQLLNEINGIC